MEQAQAAISRVVQTVVRGLVDRDEAVQVRTYGAEPIMVEISVAGPDIGKVVGKHGRMARTLRTLVQAVATKHNVRCDVNIVDGLERR